MDETSHDSADRDGPIEIEWSVSEGISSWHRIIGQSTGDKSGLVERAAVELLRHARQSDAPARQAIIDAVFEIARAAGLRDDESQAIIARAAVNPADDSNDEHAPEFSEERIALLYANRHSMDRRHVKLWGKWLYWEGVRWRVDDTQSTLNSVRQLCREIASAAKANLARGISSDRCARAVEHLASADRKLAAHPDQFDGDAWALNTPDAIIDLRTGAKSAHNPSAHCTRITAAASDGACSIVTWLAFLERAAGGDEELIGFLQRMAGYALTGSIREHALFFLYGTGANGKSTFLNAITGCAGDYHRTAAIETFTASVNERHPTDLAALRGARMVTAVETEEGRRWAESKIKSLTGGDRIAARFMRQDFFEFVPTFKLIIAGNHMPSLRSVDEAIRRRFHLVPFTVTIPPSERDLSLGEKLRGEWPGIMQWMIAGCHDWQRRGLDPPESIKRATQNYLEAEDTLSAWIEQAGVHDPNQFLLTEDLFASWVRYAKKSGEYIGSMTKFSQRLQDRGSSLGLRKDRDQTGRRGFYGLRLFAPTMPLDGGGADDQVPS
jgi:putative DNA primase/helicase